MALVVSPKQAEELDNSGGWSISPAQVIELGTRLAAAREHWMEEKIESLFFARPASRMDLLFYGLQVFCWPDEEFEQVIPESSTYTSADSDNGRFDSEALGEFVAELDPDAPAGIVQIPKEGFQTRFRYEVGVDLAKERSNSAIITTRSGV